MAKKQSAQAKKIDTLKKRDRYLVHKLDDARNEVGELKVRVAELCEEATERHALSMKLAKRKLELVAEVDTFHKQLAEAKAEAKRDREHVDRLSRLLWDQMATIGNQAVALAELVSIIGRLVPSEKVNDGKG